MTEPDLRRYPDLFEAACACVLLAAPPLADGLWATESDLVADAAERYWDGRRGALTSLEWLQAVRALVTSGALVPWTWPDCDGVAGYSRDLGEVGEVAA